MLLHLQICSQLVSPLQGCILLAIEAAQGRHAFRLGPTDLSSLRQHDVDVCPTRPAAEGGAALVHRAGESHRRQRPFICPHRGLTRRALHGNHEVFFVKISRPSLGRRRRRLCQERSGVGTYLRSRTDTDRCDLGRGKALKLSSEHPPSQTHDPPVIRLHATHDSTLKRD